MTIPYAVTRGGRGFHEWRGHLLSSASDGAKVARLVRESSWAFADQALISATNFATVVILARELAPEDFGAFVLAYAALFFVNGLQTASSPATQCPRAEPSWSRLPELHTVDGRGTRAVHRRRKPRRLRSRARRVPVGRGGARRDRRHDPRARGLAGPGVRPQDPLHGEPNRTAFAIDIVGFGGQVALILVLVADDRISAAGALYAVAAASAAGALLGGWAIRHSLRGGVRRGFLEENWAFGKWLGAAMAASWLSVQLFLYLTAIVVDASAAAGLKASQTVLGPLNAFFIFLITILPIRLAAARSGASP